MLRMQMNPRGPRASWGAVAILLAMSAKGSAAQDCPHREYAWTNTVGGVYFEDAQGRVVVDGMGRVFIGGEFADKVDFDPGEGKDNRRSRGKSDAYVTWYGSDGYYGGAYTFGSRDFDSIDGLALRPQGGLVIGGRFSGRLDFDPTKDGRDRRSPNGWANAFVSSYDADLKYEWTWTSEGNAAEAAYGLATDFAGNTIVAGIQSAGYSDVLAVKLSPTGIPLWVVTFGGVGQDSAWAAATDSTGNVIVVGEYWQTVDFDPGQGELLRTSSGERDIFISKLSPSGELLWVKTVGGEGEDTAWAATVSASDEIYIGGYFSDIVNFDPDGSGDVHDARGAWVHAFVTQYGPDGRYRWTRSFGGDGSAYVRDLALGANQRLILTGGFSERCDFDPSEGTDEKEALGNSSCYVSYWSPEGDYRMSDVFGGVGLDRTMGVAVAPEGSVYVAGDFDSPEVDFDPTPGVEEHAPVGQVDMFISKFYCGQCEYVDRHDLTKADLSVVSTVYSTMTTGRVTVVLSDGVTEITRKKRISPDGRARMVFDELLPGEYTCVIRRITGDDGNAACRGNIAERRIVLP